MNTCTSCSEANIPLNPVAQLWHTIATRWTTHLEETRKAREFDFTSDLSAETLRDIGAPEQMISNAAARRESQQQRLWDLRQWRGG